jgi:uncharacterized protein (DUF111 family)
MELATPTGVALLTVLAGAGSSAMPAMVVETTGFGAGTADPPGRPNVVQAVVGTGGVASASPGRPAIVLEANLDDVTGEVLAHTIAALMAAGAHDAWVTPIVMKKSRPAFAVSVLVHPDDEERIANEIFRHTTTIGLRRRTVVRRVLDRELLTVVVSGKDVRVKIARLEGDVVNIAPEFDDCAEVARATASTLEDVLREASVAARTALAG